jgi:hypothetical protein
VKIFHWPLRAFVLAAIALLLFTSCQNPTEAEVDADPTGYYGIDVKTTWTNKYTATGVKNGHIAYMRLRGTKWCVDKEFGEDVSFWILDVRSTNTGDSTIIGFSLELRTPAAVTSGTFIGGRYGYRVAYANTPEMALEGKADAEMVSAIIRANLERSISISRKGAAFASTMSGRPEVKVVIDFLLNTFFSDAKITQSQIEGAVVGAISFAEMRDMVKEYSKQ